LAGVLSTTSLLALSVLGLVGIILGLLRLGLGLAMVFGHLVGSFLKFGRRDRLPLLLLQLISTWPCS
jgi:hypothetical protein